MAVARSLSRQPYPTRARNLKEIHHELVQLTSGQLLSSSNEVGNSPGERIQVTSRDEYRE